MLLVPTTGSTYLGLQKMEVEGRRATVGGGLIDNFEDAPGKSSALEVEENEWTSTPIKIETSAYMSSEGELEVSQIGSCASPDKAEHIGTSEGVKLELHDPMSDGSHSLQKAQAEVPHLNQLCFALSECDSKVKTEIDEKIICPVCLIVVSDDDEAVQCDSICDKWFHIQCVGLSETEYAILGQTDNAWVCPFCPEEGLNDPNQTTIKEEPKFTHEIDEDETPSSPLGMSENYLDIDDEEYNPSSSTESEVDPSDEDFLESKSVRTKKRCHVRSRPSFEDDTLYETDSNYKINRVLVQTGPVNILSSTSKFGEKHNSMVVTRVSQLPKERFIKRNDLVECSECDYRSTSESRTDRHYREVHTKYKPYKCKMCSYRTSRSEHVETHVMRHTGERPFKCDDCPSRFHRKTDLTQHMKVHTGEKPFKCGECNFESSRRGNLQTHLLQHAGVKPFKCRKCDYQGTKESNVKKHMRVVHGDK